MPDQGEDDGAQHDHREPAEEESHEARNNSFHGTQHASSAASAHGGHGVGVTGAGDPGGTALAWGRWRVGDASDDIDGPRCAATSRGTVLVDDPGPEAELATPEAVGVPEGAASTGAEPASASAWLCAAGAESLSDCLDMRLATPNIKPPASNNRARALVRWPPTHRIMVSGGWAARSQRRIRSVRCQGWYPRQESNLGTRFRKPLLYPLSYGGWYGLVA